MKIKKKNRNLYFLYLNKQSMNKLNYAISEGN